VNRIRTNPGNLVKAYHREPGQEAIACAVAFLFARKQQKEREVLQDGGNNAETEAFCG
jgi:hypothetical protein